MTIEGCVDPNSIRDGAFFIIRDDSFEQWEPDNKELVKKFLDWARLVRGGLLAGAFEIESNITESLTDYFVSQNSDEALTRKILLREKVINSLSFDRKLSILRSALHEKDSKTNDLPISEFTKFRKIRNAMAHNPIWFEAHLQGDTITDRSIDGYVMVGSEARRLDSPTIHEWNALTKKLICNSRIDL